MLINASIQRNISLARQDATIDEIRKAAKIAQIDDLIMSLPKGYDSVLGTDCSLSGGESQRVSIARAVLADAPILIMDEATAFADPDSELEIQKALNALIKDRTVLVIAHRLNQLFTESVIDEVLLSMEKDDETSPDEILELFDLSQYRDRHPLSLSGGQKQRVAIASAVVSN